MTAVGRAVAAALAGAFAAPMAFLPVAALAAAFSSARVAALGAGFIAGGPYVGPASHEV